MASYAAIRSAACGVRPAAGSSARRATSSSKPTSSVAIGSSIVPASTALCLLTRSSVLPYSVVYRRSGSSSPSERTIRSLRSCASISISPSVSGRESIT